MSQQQLDSTMTSTTSKSSITAVKTTTTIAEEPEPSEPATVETNGESEDQAVNGVSESLESTVLSDQADQTTLEIIPEHKNEPSEVGDETLKTDETVVHEKTLEIHDEKTIEAHENELNEEKIEKVTSVDEPMDEEAPLASMESDPAPLASLDSATSSELQ